ncbi:Methyl-CpG-binding domain-containing protein 5 [Forsythia ovata]
MQLKHSSSGSLITPPPTADLVEPFKLQSQISLTTPKRPPWLPANWTIELKKRSAGCSAGNTDKYYFDPSGLKFRSKNEVLHFLATGNRLKRKSNSDAEIMPCEGPGSHKEKRTSSKLKTSEALSSDSRV